jgi:hypothetical protein
MLGASWCVDILRSLGARAVSAGESWLCKEHGRTLSISSRAVSPSSGTWRPLC